MLGSHRDNEKIKQLFSNRVYIGVTKDNGKENSSYCFIIGYTLGL